MYRNISNLPTEADCYQLTSDKTLFTYSGTTQESFALISNTYEKVSQETVSGTPPNAHCMSLADVGQLTSPYEFLSPIYQTMAIFSVVVVFFVAYRVILYPFFRSKT